MDKIRMEKWNTTAKIKTAILAIAGLTNFFMPFKPFDQSDIASTFIFPAISAIVLPSLLTLIRAKAYKNINKPKWNDNPFTNSMASAEFFAYLFIVVGICMIIGSVVKFQILNSMGVISLSFGIGIFLSLLLVDFISKKKSQ